MNALEAFVPSEVVKTFAAFLEFCYIARRNIITDDSLEQLKIALHRFHQSRQVFSGTVRADGLSGFSLPRQHSMMHYYDHIKNFGSPNGLCSSITESKHIVAVKRPWRRSNKHSALPQMLKVNERLDKLAAARADFSARGMLADSCLVHAIRDAFSRESEDLMDEDADESDGSESDHNPASDEIDALDHDHPPNNADSNPLDNVGARILDDTNTGAANTYDPNPDNDHLDDDNPNPLNQDTSTSFNDEEDDDHGPVESGPLMNEVRLVNRKGQKLPHAPIHGLNIVYSTHTRVSDIA